MVGRPRSVCSAFPFACIVALVGACASDPDPAASVRTPETSYRAWLGETCFEDENGTRVADQVAAFQRAGADWSSRERTDARGCMASAGLVEGLYAVSIEGVDGVHPVYVADGDSIRVRMGGAQAGVEYLGGPSLSSMIVDLVQARGETEGAHRRAVEQALGHPRGTRQHVIGLLASFELQGGEWMRGEDPRWQNHSVDDALRLMRSVPADSPWLTAWPTAPIGAALTLGYAPHEHPVIREMMEHHQTGPLAASVLVIQLHAARTRGDAERAEQIRGFLARVPAFATYAAAADGRG